MSSRTPFRLAAVCAALLLSACDISGLGDGSRLETLEIRKQSALLDPASKISYACFTEKLQAVGIFTRGGQGDYSTRGVWTSSNPDVVAVSNADILIPDSETLAYAAGTLVPRQAGTATISFEYVGLSASYEVEVRDLALDAVTISQSSGKLAPETRGQFSLTLAVDGYELDATQAASWSFEEDEEETEDIAVIGASSGGVRAVGVGGPLTAVATFGECRDDPRFANLKAQITVEDLDSLQLEREFTEAPNDELIVGTSELFTATGFFADGSTQPLTGQVRLVSDNEDAIVPLVTLLGGMTARAAGSANIQAVYGGDDGNDDEDDTDPPEVRSNFVLINTVERELDSFAIAPQNETIQALGTRQFVAIGTYDGGAAQQPITRLVTWAVRSLDDTGTALAQISNAPVTAGLATSLRPADGAVKIRATRGSGDEAEVHETVLCFVTPDAEPGPCPPPEED